MTFRMIVQLWNTNTSAFVSCDADLTENYMYISMKFETGVHVFCWEVGVFNRSSFQSVSYKRNVPNTSIWNLLIHLKFYKANLSEIKLWMESMNYYEAHNVMRYTYPLEADRKMDIAFSCSFKLVPIM